MGQDVPDELRLEKEGVEAAIREAFRGVTREGGTSWSESELVDNYVDDESDLKEARAKDTERCWEELVDDPSWRHEPGVGGFNFVDAIGFRYYIAPAMIRCIRDGGGDIEYVLGMESAFSRERASLLNEAQSRAVARFVRLMVAMHAAAGDETSRKEWEELYRGYWGRWE